MLRNPVTTGTHEGYVHHELCEICGAIVAEGHTDRHVQWHKENDRNRVDRSDDCCVKNCDEPSEYGMVMIIEGLRVELFACEPHFDILSGEGGG